MPLQWLLAVPKGEALSSHNPHSWPLLTWASECLQVHTPPPLQFSNWHISTTSNHRIKEHRQSPFDQVQLVTPYVGNNKLSPFFTKKSQTFQTKNYDCQRCRSAPLKPSPTRQPRRTNGLSISCTHPTKRNLINGFPASVHATRSTLLRPSTTRQVMSQ